MESPPQPLSEPGLIACRPARYLMAGLGVLCLALGVIGAFLPVMPTTIFLLMALWCFSRSSARMQRWLYDHPALGRRLRDWHRHRVIPTPAKVLALISMAASLGITALLFAPDPLTPILVAALLLPAALFILSRPSRVPDTVR